MPYKIVWVEPEVFLEYKGVAVFHSYKNDSFEDRFFYWFTTNPSGVNEISDEYQFDVRRIVVPLSETSQTVVDVLAPPVSEVEGIAATIRRAIDAGLIRPPPEEQQKGN